MPKGIPKRDGSGQGVGANRGRGGCNPPMDRGVGGNRSTTPIIQPRRNSGIRQPKSK